jgi:hypothetical protein
MRRLRSHLTYANVMATLAVVLVIGGGAAYAANTIYSTDIVDGEVRKADIHSAAVTSGKIADENLTGADIANQSGVDTCTHGANRFGELCVGVANLDQGWTAARTLCAGLELRLPTLGEALSLAKNYDIPVLPAGEAFWTDQASLYPSGGGTFDWYAYIVTEEGSAILNPQSGSAETVCVTTPTN